MKPRIGLIVSIFLLLLTTPFLTKAQEKDCRKMDITVDVTPSQNGKGGTVKVKAADNNIKFELFLLSAGADAGKYEKFRVTTGEIENVPAGTYDLIIHSMSKGYCSENRTVIVN